MTKKKGDVTYNEDDYIGASTIDFYREDVVAEIDEPNYNKVKLVNKIGARVKMVGSVTGNSYEWKPGAVVEVDERDAPDLLAKRLGNKACCGSANKNEIFAIVE